jgi:hypothetical protein
MALLEHHLFPPCLEELIPNPQPDSQKEIRRFRNIVASPAGKHLEILREVYPLIASRYGTGHFALANAKACLSSYLRQGCSLWLEEYPLGQAFGIASMVVYRQDAPGFARGLPLDAFVFPPGTTTAAPAAAGSGLFALKVALLSASIGQEGCRERMYIGCACAHPCTVYVENVFFGSRPTSFPRLPRTLVALLLQFEHEMAFCTLAWSGTGVRLFQQLGFHFKGTTTDPGLHAGIIRAADLSLALPQAPPGVDPFHPRRLPARRHSIGGHAGTPQYPLHLAYSPSRPPAWE